MFLCSFLALLSVVAAVPPVWWNSTISCGTSPYPDAGDSCLAGDGVCANVVGGVDARENEFPFMVSLERNTDGVWEHFCGGTLINEEWVLTLGACSTGVLDPSVNMRVVLGCHLRSTPSASEVTIGVVDTITHEAFDPIIGDNNDVGLVKLASLAPISAEITPACPADPADSYTGSSSAAIGWGAITRNGELQDQLKYTNVSIGSQTFCMDEMVDYTPEGKLCSGNGDYSRDTCDGDAGGPLADKINGQFVVVGIASVGTRCADNRPGIYTRVGDFSDWVTAKLEKN